MKSFKTFLLLSLLVFLSAGCDRSGHNSDKNHFSSNDSGPVVGAIGDYSEGGAAVASTAQVSRSSVGELKAWHGFGYQDGMLVATNLFTSNKRVEMTEQTVRLEYKCNGLIRGTQHVPMIEVVAAVNPSLLWEVEFHRLLAIYASLGGGSDKNNVTKTDIIVGTGTYFGQWQERLCGEISRKSVKDMMESPVISFAGGLNDLIKADTRRPFDIKVQTTKVVLPEELLRALALKAVTEATKQAPSPVVRKKIAPQAEPIDPCTAACAVQKAIPRCSQLSTQFPCG